MFVSKMNNEQDIILYMIAGIPVLRMCSQTLRWVVQLDKHPSHRVSTWKYWTL